MIAEANATPQRKQAMTAHTSRPLTVLTKSLIGPLVAVDDDAPELGPTSVFTAYEIVVEPQDEPVVPVPVEPLTDGPVEPPTAAERAYEKVAGPGSRDTAPQAPTQSPAPPPAVDPLESQRTTVDGEPFSTTDATSADPPSDVEELAPTSKRNVIDDMPLERPLFTGQMLSNDRTAVDGELPPSSYPQVSRPTPVPRVGSAPIWSTPPPASRIRSGRADRHRITWIVLGVLAVVAAGIVGFLLNRSNDTRDERLAKTRDIDAGVPILMVSDAAVVPLDATTVPIDAAVPPVDAVVESRLDASVVQSPNVSRDAGVVKVTPPPPVRNGVLYVNTDDGSWAKVTLTNEQLDTPGAAFKRKVGTYSVTIVDPQRKVTRTCSVTIGPGKQTLTVSMKSGGCTLR